MNETVKRYLPLIAMGALVVVVIIANIIKDVARSRADDEEDEPQSQYAVLPDAEPTELTESKTDAYQTARRTSIESYWDDCDGSTQDICEDGDDVYSSGGAARTEPAGASSEDLFGTPAPAPQARTAGPETQPYRETAEEREARHQRRRDEAIELATAMQQGGTAAATAEQASAQEPTPERIVIPEGRRTGAVLSSLDDGWDQTGISTLDDSEMLPDDGQHPYKCMFVRDEKIKSGGRVTIRLLEDLVLGGMTVPKNTHLMATCSISGRLELDVASLEAGGRIWPMGYEAYDMDGTKGIYCPEAGQTARAVRSRGASMVGTTLSSQVGRLASDIVNTGISLVSGAGGEATVSVPAGYTFFIVKKQMQ